MISEPAAPTSALENAVLVDARRVREGVGAHDGLVGLDVHARDAADEVARARELGGHDVGVGVQLLAVHPDCHDDLLERGVAGALAQAVDRALDLAGAVLDALEGERRGHAEDDLEAYGSNHPPECLDDGNPEHIILEHVDIVLQTYPPIFQRPCEDSVLETEEKACKHRIEQDHAKRY